MLITGQMPSLVPGHPLITATEVVSYVAAGAFAWWRIGELGRRTLRLPTAREVRTILIGSAAIILTRIAMVVQLTLTHQTKHVQSGFEHFDVVTKTPTLTALSVVLTVLTLVVLAPVVEEILFRGLLFGALAPRLGIIAAALISAILFGASHGDPILFPTLAALGFITAIAYAATGNLAVPITLHAINNALGAIALVSSSLQHHS